MCLCPFRLLSNETTGGRVSSTEFHRWLLRLPVAFISTLCFGSFSCSSFSVIDRNFYVTRLMFVPILL